MKYLPDGTPVGVGAKPVDMYADTKQPRNKSDLPPGPWTDEPDYAEWMHEGIKCVLMRGPFWSFNGYLGIPIANIFFHCDEGELWEHGLCFHGGPTYGPSRKVPGTHGITMFWWFGFDTAHAGDFTPGLRWTSAQMSGDRWPFEYPDPAGYDVYRDFDYCVNELQTAAIAMAKGNMK